MHYVISALCLHVPPIVSVLGLHGTGCQLKEGGVICQNIPLEGGREGGREEGGREGGREDRDGGTGVF